MPAYKVWATRLQLVEKIIEVYDADDLDDEVAATNVSDWEVTDTFPVENYKCSEIPQNEMEQE